MKYFITFGFDHPLVNHVFIVEAENEINARQLAAKMFPNQWAGIYDRAPQREFTAIYSNKSAELSLRDLEASYGI